MSEFNPYAAPTKPTQPSYGDADTADIFVDMLPTPAVRAAGVAAILAGVAMLFVVMQLILGAHGRVAYVLEVLVCAIGCGHFAVAWGIAGGRGWTAIGGMLQSLLAALLLMATFLMSGALSCVMATVATIVTLVLLAVNLGAIRKMGRARMAMERANRRS